MTIELESTSVLPKARPQSANEKNSIKSKQILIYYLFIVFIQLDVEAHSNRSRTSGDSSDTANF